MEASALRAPAGLSRIALPTALLKLRSDEQLVSLFRQGHEEPFRVLHDRYRARLLAYTRQMLGGSRSDAEDALQDVFLRAYSALRADDRPVTVKAWLYRVAHNRCIDHLRRPTPAPADVFDLSRTPIPDPSAETERRDDLRRLIADVQRLPEQQRSALLMREMEGLSYADLAVALDVTVPAVKSLLVRARVGLVEEAEARDTACCEIREDLTLSAGRGVRASAKARRHMRECDGCRAYRTDLRAVQAGVRSLVPGPGPLGLVAKVLGLGGGGAAAGSGAVSGGAMLGGGAAAATGAKVAAFVCCAAITAGGAVELKHRTLQVLGGGADRSAPADRAPRSPATAPAGPTPIHEGYAPRAAAAAATGTVVPRKGSAATADPRVAAAEEPISPHAYEEPAAAETTGAIATGGTAGPDEPVAETGTTAPPAAEGGATSTSGEGSAPRVDGQIGPDAAVTGTGAAGSGAGADPDDDLSDPSAAGSSGGLGAP